MYLTFCKQTDLVDMYYNPTQHASRSYTPTQLACIYVYACICVHGLRTSHTLLQIMIESSGSWPVVDSRRGVETVDDVGQNAEVANLPVYEVEGQSANSLEQSAV